MHETVEHPVVFFPRCCTALPRMPSRVAGAPGKRNHGTVPSRFNALALFGLIPRSARLELPGLQTPSMSSPLPPLSKWLKDWVILCREDASRLIPDANTQKQHLRYRVPHSRRQLREDVSRSSVVLYHASVPGAPGAGPRDGSSRGPRTKVSTAGSKDK